MARCEICNTPLFPNGDHTLHLYGYWDSIQCCSNCSLGLGMAFIHKINEDGLPYSPHRDQVKREIQARRAQAKAFDQRHNLDDESSG